MCIRDRTALVTRVAAAAPDAFRAVAGALSEASTERLRNALRGGAPRAGDARADARDAAARAPAPAAIPAPSFATFASP